MKTEILRELLVELIKKYPKNPEKLAKALVPVLLNVADNAARKYYRLSATVDENLKLKWVKDNDDN